MAIKNFIRHTRPEEEEGIIETFKNIERQVNYLRSIGQPEDTPHYLRELSHFKNKLRVITKRRLQ